MNNYILREFYLRDSENLYNLLGDKNPLFARNRYGTSTVNSLKSNVKAFLDNPHYAAYVWELESNEENIDLAYLFCTNSFTFPGIFQVEMIVNKNLSEEVYNFEAMFKAFVNLISANDLINALIFLIPEDYHKLINTLRANKLIEIDETINTGRQQNTKEDTWLKLFILNKIKNWPATWAFVPTEQAIFAIYGDENNITQTKWLNYGEYLVDILIRSLCVKNGLATEDGVLRKSYQDAKEHFKTKDRYIPASLKKAVKQSEEYFAGRRKTFDLPLLITNGTSFQRKVWQETMKIPYGSVISYEGLAARINDDNAKFARNHAQAVGQSLAKNELVVFIPCHRVIAKNGDLQGYKFDIEIKDYLLNKEIFNLKENETND